MKTYQTLKIELLEEELNDNQELLETLYEEILETEKELEAVNEKRIELQEKLAALRLEQGERLNLVDSLTDKLADL